MRSSRYNYIVNDGDSVIFFNGISESFFRVDPTRKNIYQEILNFPDEYSAKFSDFIARMKNQGFIVDNDTYYMMISPTYQCNLRCCIVFRMLEHSGRITCQLQNPEKEMSENIRRICYSIDSLYNN